MIGGLIALVADASVVMSQEKRCPTLSSIVAHPSVGAPMVSKHYMTISGDIPEEEWMKSGLGLGLAGDGLEVSDNT